MKKFFSLLLVLVIGSVLTFGMAYAIDKNRMESGKPVVFSTWGKDYTPNPEAGDNSSPDTPVQAPQNTPTTPAAPKDDTPVVTEKEVTLYFADLDLMYLKGEKRVIKTSDSIEKAVVEAVIAGPKSSDYLPSLTSDIKVNSVFVADGSTTCVVDLSKEFLLNNTGGSVSETFAIYSIVNSLCELPGIENVKINIDGNSGAVFGGHYDITKPIEPDMTIVSK